MLTLKCVGNAKKNKPRLYLNNKSDESPIGRSTHSILVQNADQYIQLEEIIMDRMYIKYIFNSSTITLGSSL